MSKNNVIKVPIMVQEYTVNTTASAKYINEIGTYLNDKMIEIQNSGIEKDSQLRIAVLAAMNITDELFTRIKNKNDLINDLEKKTRKVSSIINNKI